MHIRDYGTGAAAPPESLGYPVGMRVNHTRERLDRGETVFGCGLQAYRSAEVPRAFAAAGFDYVFIDMEHGAFDMETCPIA